jgi:hypothetical protein
MGLSGEWIFLCSTVAQPPFEYGACRLHAEYVLTPFSVRNVRLGAAIHCLTAPASYVQTPSRSNPN